MTWRGFRSGVGSTVGSFVPIKLNCSNYLEEERRAQGRDRPFAGNILVGIR